MVDKLQSFENLSYEMESWIFSISVFAAICSGIVVYTAFKFPVMWRNKIYMQMLIIVSACQFIASISIAWGFPNSLFWCSSQAMISMYFFRAGWIWSLIMIFQLRYLVIHGKIYFTIYTLHMIIWPFNLLLSILPLIFGVPYGTINSLRGLAMCVFPLTNKYFYEMVSATFIGPLQLTIVLLIFFSISLYILVRNLYKTSLHYILVTSVATYPVLMITTWLPFLIIYFTYFQKKTDIIIDNNSSIDDAFLNDPHFMKGYKQFMSVYAWTSCEPVFTSFAFFFNSYEARRRWVDWWNGTNEDQHQIRFNSTSTATSRTTSHKSSIIVATNKITLPRDSSFAHNNNNHNNNNNNYNNNSSIYFDEHDDDEELIQIIQGERNNFSESSRKRGGAGYGSSSSSSSISISNSVRGHSMTINETETENETGNNVDSPVHRPTLSSLKAPITDTQNQRPSEIINKKSADADVDSTGNNNL